MPLEETPVLDDEASKEADRLAFIAELRTYENQDGIIINDGINILSVSQLIFHLEHKTHKGMLYLLLFKHLSKKIERRKQREQARIQVQPPRGIINVIHRALSRIGI
jgi:hypothetical protein